MTGRHFGLSHGRAIRSRARGPRRGGRRVRGAVHIARHSAGAQLRELLGVLLHGYQSAVTTRRSGSGYPLRALCATVATAATAATAAGRLLLRLPTRPRPRLGLMREVVVLGEVRSVGCEGGLFAGGDCRRQEGRVGGGGVHARRAGGGPRVVRRRGVHVVDVVRADVVLHARVLGHLAVARIPVAGRAVAAHLARVPVAAILQLVRRGRRLLVEHGRVGRCLRLGTLLRPVVPHLVLHLLALLLGHATKLHGISAHAQPQALLQSAVLASVPVHPVHRAGLGARTLVVDHRGLRAAEEALAALAGDHAIVDAR